MFKAEEFERSGSVFRHIFKDLYSGAHYQHHIYVRPVALLDWIEFLKDDLGFFTLIDIAAYDFQDGHIEIVYQLLNMGSHQRLNVHLRLVREEVIPSVTRFFDNAGWLEREQREMFALTYQKEMPGLLLPDEDEDGMSLPPLRFNPNKSEPPYPEESYVWKHFGLFSPITSGDFEWLLCFDPERVVDSRVQIGFHHQGLEKILESKDLVQLCYLVDKINFSAGPSFSLAWVKTVEDIYQIDIPERAQALRIVLLELARIADHLTVLSNVCRKAHQEEFRFYLDAREKVYELFEKFIGHRQGIGAAEIGGFRMDLPAGWISEILSVADVLRKNLHVVHKSLISKRSFRKLLEGRQVDSQILLRWGVSGPAMRAAGLNFDIRKSRPDYFYKDVDFDIPVGIHGTTYDRFLIRQEEVFQSLRIITQVIDNLPLGAIVNNEFGGNYFEVCAALKRRSHKDNWHYAPIESPSGEAGFLVKIGQDLKPDRIKIKGPSFSLAQALPEFMEGLTEVQIPAALSSLGLSRWEMDR